MAKHLPFGRAYSISTYLVVIVLTAVVPVLIFSGVIATRLIESEREASNRYLAKTAAELALAFDQEITATVRTLQALSQAESIRRNDLRTYRNVLERALKTQPSWTNIVLHNDKTEGLLTARDSFGAAFGEVLDPTTITSVVQTGKPSVGKIVNVTGKINRAPSTSPFRFAVRVPILDREGSIKYVLSAILSSDLLTELVNRFSFAPDEWTRGLIDSEGVLGARSRAADQYVGKLASRTLRENIKDKAEGLELTTTLDGIEAYSAFHRAPFSKWYAAIAVPTKVLQSRAEETQRHVFLIALASLLLSALGTIYFSRWIRKSIKASSANAALLASGKPPQMDPSRISEVEEMRDSLLKASELLRSRERAKDTFLANMSHELRTPLGVVLGMADLLSQDLVSAKDKEKSWEMVKRNGQQLLRLIDDILDFSKVEANKLVVENIEFSLPDLMASVIEDFSPATRDKRVEFKLRIDDGVPKLVFTDPVRLRQILANIVGNAVKFTAQGVIEIVLHSPTNALQRITVSDTGVGLSEQQQSVLFTEFTQGDSSHTRKYGGTGLGLSLSRKLAQRLGGDVQLICSREGEGSIFEITFQTQLKP